MTTDLRPRVLHVGKFYPPVSGGMERVLQLLCDRERTAVDTRVLVANTGRTTVHDTVDGVPVTRVANLGSVGSVAVCPTLSLWLSRERADVVVIHEPNPMALVAYALARPPGKLIVWFHSEVVRDRWQYALFYRPWFAHALRRAARVIVASPPMCEAEQLRGFQNKTTVIPYGVDQTRLQLTPAIRARSERLRADHRGPLILFVGRMVPYKGLDVLLRSMVDVPATAILVGDGPERPSLQALARTLGVDSKVVFTGEVNDSRTDRLVLRVRYVRPAVDHPRRGIRRRPDRSHGVREAGCQHRRALWGALGQSPRRDRAGRSTGRRSKAGCRSGHACG